MFLSLSSFLYCFFPQLPQPGQPFIAHLSALWVAINWKLSIRGSSWNLNANANDGLMSHFQIQFFSAS